MYEELPRWMQQGVLSWNAASIELENYSRIKVATTTEDSGRSGSVSLLILDEFAFVRNNIADAFWRAAYPVISSGKESKVIIISTANGLNTFYKMWIDAIDGNSSFVPYEVSWMDVPGRDNKWRKETIANMGGDEDKFKQEYENSFLGNAKTLIPISKLKAMAHRKPLVHKGEYKIYEEPRSDRTYFLTCDVARGVGNDYSIIQVLDITEYPYKQVAVYRNNKIETLILPRVLTEWAQRYNNGYILLEGNDMGESVGDVIYYELEYDNLILVSHQGRAGQRLGGGFGKTVRTGVMTSVRTKNIGTNSLKNLIMADQLIIQDFDTIHEFSTFALKGKSYEAEEGSNDDLVMGLVIFGWAITEPYFKDITDQDLRIKMEEERLSEMMESVPIFGFIEDGLGDDGWVDVM